MESVVLFVQELYSWIIWTNVSLNVKLVTSTTQSLKSVDYATMVVPHVMDPYQQTVWHVQLDYYRTNLDVFKLVLLEPSSMDYCVHYAQMVVLHVRVLKVVLLVWMVSSMEINVSMSVILDFMEKLNPKLARHVTQVVLLVQDPYTVNVQYVMKVIC